MASYIVLKLYSYQSTNKILGFIMSNRSNRSNVVIDTPVIDTPVIDTPVIDTPVNVSPVNVSPVVETVDDMDQTDRDRYNAALQKASDLAEIKHEKMLVNYYAKELATVKFNRDRAIFFAQFAKDLQALQKSVNNRK